MQWAERRRLGIATGIVLIVASATALVWYFFIYEPASCTDGLKNQSERGIDCDGECARMCQAPRVDALWTRAVQTAPGVYHGVSLVKNPEPHAQGVGLTYRMSLFDSSNILVAERRGTVDLLPGETRVVFEPNIITGERVPVRALIKIDGGIWERATPVTALVRGTPGAVDEEKQTVHARLENLTPAPVRDVIADVLLFDSEGILVTASQTRIPLLGARERQDVVFTWDQPFVRPVATVDVVTRASLVEE